MILNKIIFNITHTVISCQVQKHITNDVKDRSRSRRPKKNKLLLVRLAKK